MGDRWNLPVESDLLLGVVARSMPAPCSYAFGSRPGPDDPVVFLGPVRRGIGEVSLKCVSETE